jgi:hypothetical protein
MHPGVAGTRHRQIQLLWDESVNSWRHAVPSVWSRWEIQLKRSRYLLTVSWKASMSVDSKNHCSVCSRSRFVFDLTRCWEHVGNMSIGLPGAAVFATWSHVGPPDLARSQRDGLRPAPPRSPAAVLRCLQVTVAFLMADIGRWQW